MQDRQPTSLADLFGHFLDQVSTLLRIELRLAVAETAQKARQAKTGLILAVTGAFVGLLALFKLFDAAALALVDYAGLTPAIATLAVGAATLLIAAILLFAGSRKLNANALRPERTLHSLQRDAELAKETIS